MIDKHVVKMPTESLQMISTIVEMHGYGHPFKPVMANHPCTIWARESVQNYNWLYAYFEALSNEKSHRYPTGPNITRAQFGKFLKNPPKNIRDIQFTSPALAMPDEYKCSDPVQAYRNYYIGDKYYFAKWTKRNIPEWYYAHI